MTAGEAPPPRLGDRRRALVLHTAGLGDLLLSLPALLALGFRLDFWGRPEHLLALRELPSIGKREPFERPGIHLLFADGAPASAPGPWAREIASADLVIPFLGERGGVLERNLLALGARAVATASVPRRDARGAPHATRRIREDVARAGFALAPHEPLRLEPAAGARGKAAAVRRAAGLPDGKFLLLHPGSGDPRKNWPLDRFVAIARGAESGFGLAPLFVTGPADGEAARRIGRETPPLPRIDSPETDVLLALFSDASLYLGNDSGASHLAAAAGARGVAIFGPSDPLVWAPDSPLLKALRAGDSPEAVSVGAARDALAAAAAPP